MQISTVTHFSWRFTRTYIFSSPPPPKKLDETLQAFWHEYNFSETNSYSFLHILTDSLGLTITYRAFIKKFNLP